MNATDEGFFLAYVRFFKFRHQYFKEDFFDLVQSKKNKEENLSKITLSKLKGPYTR